MQYCIVNLISQSASFRNPDFQNFHKSYILPPPTTIIGILGAALGLNPKAAQIFFYENSIKIGISGKSSGKVTDLWKYNDFKNGSIMLREIYFYNEYIIIFGSEDNTEINRIYQSLVNPVYTLTMGNSDSLAFIKKVEKPAEYEIINECRIANCLVNGNLLKDVIDNINSGFELSVYSSSSPICFDLPVKFAYEGDYAMRRVIKRMPFSFISREMTLNFKIQGIKYNDIFIPLLDIC